MTYRTAQEKIKITPVKVSNFCFSLSKEGRDSFQSNFESLLSPIQTLIAGFCHLLKFKSILVTKIKKKSKPNTVVTCMYITIRTLRITYQQNQAFLFG